jgi:hypothetical protein
MELTLAALTLGLGIAGAALYVLWTLFGPRRDAPFDAGAVSQSWLIEHQTTAQGGRGDR